MARNDNGPVVGADSVAVESIIIALFSLLFEVTTTWDYHLVFQLALGGVLVIMLFRVMAGRAESPNIDLIEGSLQWSSRLLQLVFIGAFATISIQINTFIEYFSPVTLFIGISFAFPFLFVLLDRLVLGEYFERWASIAHNETGDNMIGHTIRNAADFGLDNIEAMTNSESTPPQSGRMGLSIAFRLLLLLLIIIAPIGFILSKFFGGTMVAIMVVLSILFLRDLSRYLYVISTGITSLEKLKWRLRWEILWTILAGVLLADVLGYNLMAVL